MNNPRIKVALVHDFLVQYGGAERVLEAMSEMYPEAPIYTLLYDKNKMHGKFCGKVIKTSFLQRLPYFLRKHYRWFLPIMPVAAETLDLRDFNLVISSSSAWTKGIVTRLNTVHVAYLHSPIRFLWEDRENYAKENLRFGFFRLAVRFCTNYLRIWDWAATDRPDFLLVNSIYTKERVKRYYNRESVVCYPPVKDHTKLIDEKKEKAIKNDFPNGYFLVVSRLAKYKNLEPIIEAFNKLEMPLVVIGEGREEKKLKKIAKENIHILGWQSDENLAAWLCNARAFVFANTEDFGIAPAEALRAGVPVITIDRGGVREMINAGENGEIFEEPTAEIISDAVRRFREKEGHYSRSNIKEEAKKFSQENFKENISKQIDKWLE